MTNTENDYYEETQKVINTRKDFNALDTPFLSNKITYSPVGFNRSNLNASSFVVDWQLFVEKDLDTILY